MNKEGTWNWEVSPGLGARPCGFQFQVCHPKYCELWFSVFTGTELPWDAILLSRPSEFWASHGPMFSPLAHPML